MVLTSGSMPRGVRFGIMGASAFLWGWGLFFLGGTRPRAAVAQSSPVTEKAKPADPAGTTAAMESLVADLESLAREQRVQLQRTEASLERARAVLRDLNRRPDPGSPFQNQAAANENEWSWPTDAVVAAVGVRQPLGDDYEIEATAVPIHAGASKAQTGKAQAGEVQKKAAVGPAPRIIVRHRGREIVGWETTDPWVFVRGGRILFRAMFSPYATGCEVAAYDLEARGELWKTRLTGIGPLGHSMYTNRVTMKLDGDRLTVFGNESAGRYIERLDTETGQIVSHSKLSRGGLGKMMQP